MNRAWKPLVILVLAVMAIFLATVILPHRAAEPWTPSLTSTVLDEIGAAITAAPETPVPTPVLTATPVPLAPTVSEHRVAAGTEPSISADPSRPGMVAVVSENIVGANGHVCSIPAVRVSRDYGATWGSASYPWGRSCQDVHAVIAWGSGRLWAADAIGVSGGVSISVTYSDNDGKSWSKPYVERRTRPWVGCFPAIAVDNEPTSPDFGAVFVAYNWPQSSKGPGVSVIASFDGRAFAIAQVPAVALTKGYGNYNRIGYRIASGNGFTWLSFYQADLKTYVPPGKGAIITEGSRSNVGRRIVAVTDLELGGDAARPVLASGTSMPPFNEAAPPAIAISNKGLDLWQTALAVGYGDVWVVGSAGGKIILSHEVITDRLTWETQTFSVAGKSSSKPSVAVDPLSETIFVGWHAQSGGRTWTYFTLSYDGGSTWIAPALVSQSSWRMPSGYNGVGLRENAVFVDGQVFWAYGDARSGEAVYVAVVTP